MRSPGAIDYVKLSECHDFLWSKTLWKKAADETAKLSCLMLILYIGLGSYLMAYMNGLSGIDAWYFLIATLTTVGYGDYAPEDQFTRGCSIVMIPFGLGILGFGLSYLIAYSNSKPYKQRRAGGVGPSKQVGGGNKNMQRQGAMLNQKNKSKNFDKSFSSLSSSSSSSSSSWNSLRMSEINEIEENRKYYHFLKIILHKFKDYLSFLSIWLSDSIIGKSVSLIFKISLVVFVGALFFKSHPPEIERLDLTWTDALYFGTVTATSIGYGDITAQSEGGKLFLCFYMLISTILMADCLSDFIDLYVSDIVGERIIDEIIDSTTWVHKCDLDRDGKVSEADYVLFKLQQMQKVDANMMDMLIDKYHDLDVDGEGALDVGIDIPSAEQVKTMKELIARTNTPRTLLELWHDMQESLKRQRTESKSFSMPPQENPMKVLTTSIEESNIDDKNIDADRLYSKNKDNDDRMTDAQISEPLNIEMIEFELKQKNNGGSNV